MAADGTGLSDILDRRAQVLLAEFEESREYEHRPSKGTVRETIALQGFVQRYAPRTVEVSGSGEILAADGSRSGQCDVLVTDPGAPFLLANDDYRIAAAEAVYGVLEVKSFLSSAELKDAMRKIAMVKRLPKTAYLPNHGIVRSRTVYGRLWTFMPTAGMVIAYDGASIETLGEAFAEVAAELAETPELLVDSVWVLKQGAITWRSPTGRIQVCPEPGDYFQAIEATPGQVLLHLTYQLHELFATAWTDGLRILAYGEEAHLGMVKRVWAPDTESSAVDEGATEATPPEQQPGGCC